MYCPCSVDVRSVNKLFKIININVRYEIVSLGVNNHLSAQ